MAGTFELKRSADEQFYFTLKASNGEVILTGETYASQSGAENGIASVKANAPDIARYAVYESANGEWYFVLKAANGEVIGVSEMYSSIAAVENGIDSVKRHAPAASTVNLT